jgi:hypothetical protein
MKILVVYFSWTGSVARLAEFLRSRLEPFGPVETARIKPVVDRSYWGWLFRSFLPGWRVPIEPVNTDLGEYDRVCIGFPKWTLACPPVNEYLRAMRLTGCSRIALFMSHGGFDGARYLRGIAKKVTRKRARLDATISIRRSTIRDGSFKSEMVRFCDEILSADPRS